MRSYWCLWLEANTTRFILVLFCWFISLSPTVRNLILIIYYNQQIFTLRGKVTNILSFASHLVSAPIPHISFHVSWSIIFSLNFFSHLKVKKNKVLYLWAVQKWTEFGPQTLACWPIFSAIYLFVQSQYSCFRTAHWGRQIYQLEQCLWTVLFILVLTVKMLSPKLLYLILSSAFPAEY